MPFLLSQIRAAISFSLASSAGVSLFRGPSLFHLSSKSLPLLSPTCSSPPLILFWTYFPPIAENVTSAPPQGSLDVPELIFPFLQGLRIFLSVFFVSGASYHVVRTSVERVLCCPPFSRRFSASLVLWRTTLPL